LEAEVAGMDSAEAGELLAEYGVTSTAAERVPQQVYGILDLVTFFTINEQESRAWELRRGAKAPEAAGTIHSDMERGFIRAEVGAFDRIEAAGSWNAAKAAGDVRVEGKDYVVADGDVIRIRFSV
jgi:ribosome-binding ATPase YchF (GTP1/OBG family)